jgi:peptide/nickel transport system substrate-binding protein
MPTTGPFQPGTWPYNPDPGIQPFDPAKASALLTALGWNDTDADWILDKGGRKLEFTVLAGEGDKLMDATIMRLQWQLLQVGIKLNVETGPLENLLADRVSQGKFQSFLIQLANYVNNPDAMVSSFWHSAAIGRFNLSSYSNPELDRLIGLGRATTDQAEKTVIYQQIHKTLGGDAPAAFLYYRKRYTAMTARLKGIPSSAAGVFYNGMFDWYVTK